MKMIFKMAVATAAVLALTAPASAGKCVRAGGEATMVTQDLAKFMANAALKNSIANHKWKAKGPITVKCDTGTIGLAHCTARQKACS